jgi:flagellar secretion chaperone FliS
MNWKAAYLETRVLSADPIELVNILYEYATLGVQDARSSLSQGDIAARAKAIAKVIAILGELESSLDHKLGGEIARHLARLYRYMREKLTLANLKQADEPLAEVEALLKTLGEAWQAIGQDAKAGQYDAGRMKLPDDYSPVQVMESIPGYGAHSYSLSYSVDF